MALLAQLENLSKATREKLLERAQARHELTIRIARQDPAAFNEYVLRNEQDGTKLENAPFHDDWHEHLTANRFAVLICPIEHGKTQQVAVGRVLYELGRNPSLRLAIISNTSEQAEKVLRQVRTEIERNPRLREVFPELVPSDRQEDPWHTTAITVKRDTISKDPSLQCCGAFGPINGSRLDGVILDDVLDFESTRTEEQRKKLIQWVENTVIQRLTVRAFLWAIGTPWHPEDLLHDLSARPRFVTRRYSAVENPDDPSALWRPLWPQQWTVGRLLERRAVTGELNFARKLLCRVRLDTTSRFKQVWIDYMVAMGKGRSFLSRAPKRHQHGPEMPCFTGVDLGAGLGEASALTVLFTLALMPDGKRLVVDIEAGRWQSPEIVARITSAYQRYNSTIAVEDVGAQRHLVDLCQVPVQGFTTGRNKHNEEYGVESLAFEMCNRLWVMPSGVDGQHVHPEGKAFISECLYYSPDVHTGDRLMAGWIAREALRRYQAGRTRKAPTLAR